MNIVGSKWWKFDFHTHTPASFDYGRGNESLKNITPRDWLQNFIDVGIECIAVTDHNTGEWIDKLKTESEVLQNEGHNITIFPAVEISVSGGVHILGIFEPSKTSTDITKLLGVVKYNGDMGDSNAVTKLGVEEVIDEIIDAGGIAIPAHIDKPAGLCYVFSTGVTLTQNIQKIAAVEVIDKTAGCLSVYHSHRKDYAEVIGSDSHLPCEAGRNFTWVKMSKPSLEGLKLALLDREISIKRFDEINSNPNECSSSRLTHLKIQNAKYCGRAAPLEIQFNPWMNSIIGGRGSGKSTLIEFIRLGLNRKHEIEKLPEILNSFSRFAQKPEKRGDEGVFTENTNVEIGYIKDNVQFKLEWNISNQQTKISKRQDNNWTADIGDINSRFPVRLFSQKQLFELSKNPNALLNIIDESPLVDAKEWKNRWNEEKNNFVNLRGEQSQLSLRISNKEKLIGDLSDISNKIRLFEESNYKNTFIEYQKSQLKDRDLTQYISSLKNSLLSVESALKNNLLNEFNSSSFNLNSFNDSEVVNKISAFRLHTNESIQKMIQEILSLKDVANQFHAWIEDSNFKSDIRKNKSEYDAVHASLKQAGLDTERYQQLIAQKSNIEQQLKKIDDDIQQQIAISEKIGNSYQNLARLRAELTTKRQSFISTILQENRNIKIEIKALSDKLETEASFRQSIEKTGLAFSSDILDNEKNLGVIFDLYIQIDSEENMGNRFSVIHKFKSDLLSPSLASKVGKKFFDYISNLTNQDKIWYWFPEDEVCISYRDGNNYKDISIGSAGQKTATILTFLLSYGDEPLILDQPEDDLDNELISSLIVRTLKEKKAKRQIIVVTHNPNIVVNSDSELVISLVSAHGQSYIADNGNGVGGLQESSVREFVCKIMEGGRQAFEHRYKRIIGY